MSSCILGIFWIWFILQNKGQDMSASAASILTFMENIFNL